MYTYLTLEFKKGIQLFVKTLGSMLIMLTLLFAGIFVISQFVFQSTAFETLNVGLAIPEDEGATRLVTRVISSMDSVKSICSFQYMDQEEALDFLKAGELRAVISLPDSFYQDVYTGINTPATVYFPYNSSLNETVFQELLVDGVSMLQTAESAVYAFLDVAKDQQLQVAPEQLGDVIAYIYIDLAFGRNQIFNQTVLSSMGSLNIYEYYFACAVAIFMLLSGLNYGMFYRKQSRAVEQKLFFYGLKKWKVGLVKIGVMTCFLWILEGVLYLSGCLIATLAESTFLVFDIRTLAYMLPQCFGVAAFFHMAYKIGKEGMQGTVLLLIATIGMVICSGAVIPVAYLPEIVGRLGTILPLTFWNHYCAETFFGTLGFGQIIVAIVIGCLEFGIGEIVTWKNT